ncbi:GNAT family N-acetyltransferase [Gemmatimonas groenlandica]|uniref:GNAT family N-acetyltransferase n=1 Tax=Gemmatimonas groenlandica TaxID=2732249 RepID=A0A6M4IWR0_9BACT|nr:GNAT family N-acetyltransferase [Gemmatimonas groenlandica]QJR38016.1 GNAT family N-acetyltransferase [Gemmatimonas groenlandica]
MTTPQQSTRGTVRLATEADHDAIHALNYRTFVEEIPQHAPNATRRHVDRFHDDNVYAVYEVNGRIVGMISGRTQRPFSLDQKLGSVDDYLPAGRTPVEIRLLAVEPEFRASRVFTQLVGFLTQHFLAKGFDLGIMSGTTRQLRLYRHLGFHAFGPLIGTEQAAYQPMYITAEEVLMWPDALNEGADALGVGANFLPGPVGISDVVQQAMNRGATSHRAESFHARYRDVQWRLCALADAQNATMLLGSGTLANDVVAAQISLLDAPGVIVSNGEFGERLIDHATRMQIPHTVVRAPWGEPLDYAEIAVAVRSTNARWLWAVHGETSTGVINDLATLTAIAQDHRAKMALDVISSLGTVPLSLRHVWLASAVSGKALSAFPGIAIVFHDGQIHSASHRIPRYLDLGLAVQEQGVPFTQSSNLLDALGTSLAEIDWSARFDRVAHDGTWLRRAMESRGWRLLASAEHASPAVHTLVPPVGASARAIGEQLRAAGWLISFESGYLRERNWLQVCLMGHYAPVSLRSFPAALDRCTPTAAVKPPVHSTPLGEFASARRATA